MRRLVSLKEQSPKDLLEILKLAQKIKARNKTGKKTDYLKNKTLIMLFEKTSTRTRLSFEAAMTQLGGHAIFLDARTTQLAVGCDFGDEIKAAMRYGDILMYRAKKAANVIRATSYNQIPVIDGCSEKYHPCQALGDILTMMEYSKGLKNIKKIAWLGIENNVANTLKLACAKLGIKVLIFSPTANGPSVDAELNQMAEKTGNVIKTKDLKRLKEVSYLHTDSWIDMEYFENGRVKPEFKKEYQKRIRLYQPLQINSQLIKKYAPKAKIMHCMPCHLGYEITREAVDHPNSVIFKQAENRLHIQKAILLWLLRRKV